MDDFSPNTTLRVSHSGLIDAPPAVVYRILADYRGEHPRIVPKPWFRGLEVEQGGVGAGTIVRVEMRVMGTTQRLRHAISEPEPGRVLLETDLAGASATTFTVDPVEEGRARLTIATEFRTRAGLLGAAERWLIGRLTARMYPREIALIAARARELS